MSSIFPFIDTGRITAPEKPMYRDVKIDSEGNPVIKDGEIVFCEGREALKSWCFFALMTQRKKYRCLSQNYGNDIIKLVGKAFLPETTEAEGKRYIKECLMANRYIRSVENIAVTFDEGEFSASFIIKTDYGEAEVHV